jgi:hypothetical protein
MRSAKSSGRALIVLCLVGALACGDDTPAATQPKPAPATPQLAPSVQAPAPAVEQQPPKRLFAKRFVVKVRTAPNKDAFRIGYLRGGAVLMAKSAEPIGFDQCRKGWFELETGGFVCSTVELIAFLGKKLPERRTLQPDLSALLPYPYGYSRRKNTPMYRRLPTDEESALNEGLALPGALAAVPSAEAAASDPNAAVASPAAAPTPRAVPLTPPGAITAPATGTAIAGDAIDEAGAPGSGESDAGVPTLASLMGAQDSVLMRRMQRGFYVSLDREMERGSRKYFRTQSNGFIPARAIVPVKPSEFRGVELGAPDAKVGDAASDAVPFSLPIAFVMSRDFFAYAPNKAGKLRPAKKPGYHHLFRVTGTMEQGGTTFLLGEDGQAYRSRDVARIDAREKPAAIADDEKWLDVDLSTQSLVAYVGKTPVFATLVSTGRIKDELDPLKNFETPVGEFRITSKHLTATMDGDHAIDGPYSIEDVPYVMYFQLAYALHSAFWHNAFGRPRSHGCINLAPFDARFVFNFIEPPLPALWHGVFPKPDEPGTRLIIRGKTPEG